MSILTLILLFCYLLFFFFWLLTVPRMWDFWFDVIFWFYWAYMYSFLFGHWFWHDLCALKIIFLLIFGEFYTIYFYHIYHSPISSQITHIPIYPTLCAPSHLKPIRYNLWLPFTLICVAFHWIVINQPRVYNRLSLIVSIQIMTWRRIIIYECLALA